LKDGCLQEETQSMKKLNIALLTFLLVALLGAVAIRAQSNSNDKSNNARESDQPLKIKRKPQPGIGNCGQSAGLTRLRVTFDKSGKVGGAEIIVSSGCDGFDRQAVKAANKIKFTPQIKNGEPVTVTKLVEYIFRRF
jgi:TonB family protein